MAGRDTKTEIIDAAVRILGRDGPDGFSASALAREVGVSKATLFHHFASIDEIPVAAFDRLAQQMLRWQPEGEATRDDVLAFLGERTFETVKARREFLGAYFVFFGKAMFDERLNRRLRRSGEDFVERIGGMLGPGAATDDAAALARLSAIVLDGMALHLLALGDAPEIEEAWQLFRRLVARQGSKA